jgi:RNA polymerase sigma-70 factor (ECF subfamily)
VPKPAPADPRIAAHLPLARAMARKFVRRVGGMLEFDDLLSIAMAAMWKKAPDFDETRGATFGQYAELCMWTALRLEQNKVWNERRRAWLQQESIHPKDDEDRGIQLLSAAPSPQELVSKAQLFRKVRDTVSGLPEKQREAIELCFFDEMTLAEAGALSGVSRQAVEQHQRKAIASLKHRLRDQHDDEQKDGGDHG